MTNRAPKWLGVIFAAQAVFACAQAPVAPAPNFTLTISQVGYGGSTPGNYAVLVRQKNISKDEIHGEGCLALRDWFNVSVVHDGVPAEETDFAKSLKKFRESGAGCNGSHTGWMIQPGEEHYYQLNVNEFCDMSKPGTYEITVTKETYPKNLELSVTVKSNTITIIVPKS